MPEIKLFRMIIAAALVAMTALAPAHAASILRGGSNGLWFAGQQKPIGPVEIDWSNPVSVGLELFIYDDGYVVRDVVSGVIATPDTTPANYTSSVSLFGAGLKYPDNTTLAGVSLVSSARIEALVPPLAWDCNYFRTA